MPYWEAGKEGKSTPKVFEGFTNDFRVVVRPFSAIGWDTTQIYRKKNSPFRILAEGGQRGMVRQKLVLKSLIREMHDSCRELRNPAQD